MGEVLRQVLSRWRAHRRLILFFSLMLFLADAVGLGLELIGPAGVAVHLGLSLAVTSLFHGLVAALICMPGRARDLGGLVAIVRPVFARLVWASLLYVVASLVGIALLIVPGLIALTIWSLTAPVIVTSGSTVLEAFGRSRELVRGNGFRVFGVLLISGVLGALIVLISASAGSALAAGLLSGLLLSLVVEPYLSLATAILFLRLSDARPRPEDPSPY